MHKKFALSIALIRETISQAPKFGNLQEAISQKGATASLNGLSGSSLSFVLAESFKRADRPFLLLLEDKEEAAYYLNDLEELLGDRDVLFYPGSYRRPYEIEETDNANVLLRAEVLNRINSRKKPALIVSYPDAVFEKVVTRKELEKNTLKLKVGDAISLDFLNEVLFEYHFRRVDFVTEPGEFSVRGGIVDVFSFSHDEPYRIEFFGDEIDSIRTFDVETQLSLEKGKKISIIPNVADKVVHESRESFLKYISADTVVFLKQPELSYRLLDQLFQKAEEAFAKLPTELSHADPSKLFMNAARFRDDLTPFTRVFLDSRSGNEAPARQLQFDVKPQPAFNKRFEYLLETLAENHRKGLQNFLFFSSQQNAHWAFAAIQTIRSLNATTAST